MEPRSEGPDFVGVGVQKSGSTWFADILAQHPAILIPKKEIHFFNRYFYKGYHWYHNLFRNKKGRLAGDFTPNYFISPSSDPMHKEFYPHWNLRRILLYHRRKAPQPNTGYKAFCDYRKLRRILLFWFQQPSARDELKTHYPRIRVFAIFRNPVDRAWFRILGLEASKRTAQQKIRLLDEFWINDGRWVQSHGLYAHYLTYWRESFPEFGVFFYDDIEKDPTDLAQAAYRFIGVDDTFKPATNRWLNKGEYTPMPASIREMLINFYREQILRFAEMTGRDLSHWLKC